MRSATTARSLLPLLLVPALVLPAAACSPTAGDPKSASDTATAPHGRAPSGTGRPSGTPKSPQPSPRTSAPPARGAADGTDAKACGDADCEILVHGTVRIPLAPGFGCSGFLLTFVKPNQVTFDIYRTESNDVNGYLKGTGYLGLSNGVKVTLERSGASGAVVRFEPKTMDPKNDEVSASQGAALYG